MICVGQIKLPLLEFLSLSEQGQFVQQLIHVACAIEFEVNFMTSLGSFSSQIFETPGDWGEIGELWHKLYCVSCPRFVSLNCMSCIPSRICIFQTFWGQMKILFPFYIQRTKC